MAVKIRLTRMGDKKSPFYRLVVADSKSPRDGKFIEILGTYNPLTNPSEIKVDSEKVKTWISQGAKPTETAKDILVKAGIMKKPAVIKTNAKPKPKRKQKAEK
ncbi:MAG: 30S ribosomal protein S16 [Clostridia bacterium]|nr:30S ribosomal protein S16 [Clostridia bacterium]